MYGYIYLTENLIDGRCYIGQHRESKFDPRYLGSGKLLTEDIKKLGNKNFIVTLIEECETNEQLNEREIYWITRCQAASSPYFYNLAKGGNTLQLGEKYLEELSIKMKGNTFGFKKGNKPWNTGKHFSEESKAKMRKPHGVKTLGSTGYTWYTNGIEEIFTLDECPEGFTKGRLPKSEEVKNKIGLKAAGKKWYNNGLISKLFLPDNVPEGWVPGRLNVRKENKCI